MNSKKHLLQFSRKTLLFFSPFIAAAFVELFILPINFFTFRIWESLAVYTSSYLRGPFYPNQAVEMIETGDMGHKNSLATFRNNRWVTDSYGYRNFLIYNQPPEIVIVGDSNITGTGLLQRQTLAHLLKLDLKTEVYPLAPSSTYTFFHEERFRRQRPKILIFSSIERALHQLGQCDEKWLVEESYPEITNTQWQSLLSRLSILLDRLSKRPLYHKIRSEILSNDSHLTLSKDGSMIFLQGLEALKEKSDAEVEAVSSMIISCDRTAKKMGLRMIFLPIPNKETILYDFIEWGTRSDYLERIHARITSAGVEAIPTQSLFESHRKKTGELLYQRDDSHWDATGIELVKSELLKRIRNQLN